MGKTKRGATVTIDSELHQKLRIEAARKGTNMRNILDGLLRKHFSSGRKAGRR